MFHKKQPLFSLKMFSIIDFYESIFKEIGVTFLTKGLPIAKIPKNSSHLGL